MDERDDEHVVFGDAGQCDGHQLERHKLLRKMTAIACEKCGNTFTPARPQSASEALSSERRLLDVAPELREAEECICPKCGHKQRVNVYLFFGFLTAQGVRVVLGVIIAGMLAFAVWWGLLRR